MSLRIYVPADTTAAALGADAVAALVVSEASKRGLSFELVRNGSRGAYWLEPLLEVEDAQPIQRSGDAKRQAELLCDGERVLEVLPCR